MGPRLTEQARALVVEQRGLIADWQAAPVGLSRRRLLWACRSGWRQVTPTVFADRAEALTPAQQRVAGVLEGGPDALLTGRGALVEGGWPAGTAGSLTSSCRGV